MKTFQELLSTNEINLQDFENYRLEQMQVEQQKINKALYLTLGIGGGLILILSLLMLIPGIVFVIILGFIAFFGVRMNIKGVYVKEFKSNLLNKLVKIMDPSFNYQPTGFITADIFRKSNFIKGWSRYNGEDYFTGTILDKKFECSEITVQTKSGKNSYHTVYRGMFFVIDYQGLTNNRIDIIPDSAEKFWGTIGNFFQSMNAFRDKLIKFDNEQFEKDYVVYSNNEDDARTIVNEKLIDYLVELRNSKGRNVYLSFNESKIFFGLDNRHDIFQVDIKKSILDKSFIKTYYDDLANYIEILTNLMNTLQNRRKSSSIIV